MSERRVAIERHGHTTRRQLMAAALAAGAVLRTGLVDAQAAGAAEVAESDAQLVHDVLAVEMLAVAVYESVLRSGLLSARPRRVSRRALSQERTHVRLLSASLLKLGGTVPPLLPDQAAVDRQLAARHVTGSLAKLRTEHDCGSLLLDLEAVLEGAYFKVMSRLRDPGLQRLAAQIMANEAQHAAAISEARAPGNIYQAVPYAFIEGRP